jgi:DNA polymerase I-like protein with 3'-5' exonuclease and polymerase domains
MVKFEDHQYVNTEAKLAKLDQILMDGDSPRFSVLAFDTESNGVEFHEKVVIGFSIATDRYHGYYVPLLEWKRDETFFKKDKKFGELGSIDVFPKGNLVDVWTGEVLPEFVTSKEWKMPEMIRGFLERWTKTNLIMHNAAFDCNIVAYNTGIDLTPNLFCDTILLKHAIDENPPHGLKEVASSWKKEIGFNPDEDAASEMKELGVSIIRNGGKFSKMIRFVWRGDGPLVAKYAAADAALTFGVYEVGLQKFQEAFTPKHLDWFFGKEIMPLAREVVIPMTCGGMYIDSQYYKELIEETEKILLRLEDEAINALGPMAYECPYGDEPEKAVSKKALNEKILELEGLTYPTITKKGETKQSLAKDAIKLAYESTGHWFYEYLLGEGTMRYSDQKLEDLKDEIYYEENEKARPRYKFNIRSGKQLRWVLFDKLGNNAADFPQTDKATDENPEASLAGEILEEHFKGKYEFINPIIKYLKLHKMISTYAKPLFKKQHGGYVHMDMRQYGTTSGRFACRRPNMQNLPAVKDFGICGSCESKNVTVENPAMLLANIKCKDCGHEVFEVRDPSAIKKGFIAPPGQKIVNADFESLEPKCFAFMSGDEGLKAVYKQGLDLYSKVYCDMFDPKFEKYSASKKDPNYLGKVAPDKRKEIKPIVLGIPYGEDDWKVADTLGLKIKKRFFNEALRTWEEKEIVDVEKGNFYRTLYLEAYPRLKDYMYQCEFDALNLGYVETLVGRRRHFKVAPAMNKLFLHYGVGFQEFMKLSNSKLKWSTPRDLPFTKEDLFNVCTDSGIPYYIVKENDNWAFLKSKLKNELNNAKNFPIQGLAAHITNTAMIDIMRAFRQNGIDGYVCCQVHDEITCYVREDQAQQAKEIVQECMERNEVTALLDIPMRAEPLIANNLKEAK